MAKGKKKASVKVKDMASKNNPKGGYLKIKMTEAQITSVNPGGTKSSTDGLDAGVHLKYDIKNER